MPDINVAVRPGSPTRLGIGQAHSAFPGACLLADGRLLLAWREATDHVASRDGVIRTSISDDDGLTWSVPVTAVADEEWDLRDPSLAHSDGTTWLTYFKGSGELAGAGCFVRASTDGGHTWGRETRIDDLPCAAIAAPLLRLPCGDLLVVFYGRAGSESYDSCWASRSGDGTTWAAPVRVADGPTDGRHYQEPWPVAAGDEVVVLFRHGTQHSIGTVRSGDGASTWSAPEVAFTGSGRPSAVYTSSGVLVVTYRSLPGKHAHMRASRDGGRTWYPPRLVALHGGVWFVYAAPVEIAPGLVCCPFANEVSDTSSTLHVSYVLDGHRVSPRGEENPGLTQRIITDRDLVLAADSFDRPDSADPGCTPDGLRWYGDGTVRIEGGALRAGTADGRPDYAWVYVDNPDVDIAADLLWTGATGNGIVFRAHSPGNFFLLTAESGGTFIRCYNIRGGSPTLLKETSWTVRPDVYHRFRVSVRGDIAYWFMDGRFVDVAILPEHPRRGWHGLKLNDPSSGAHRCRRFVVTA
jgi:hypothetical protein